MIKLTKSKKIKNPYITDYGYHLTNSKNLDNILKHGLKRKIYHKKDNYERWVLNNVLYGGKSPIYFFANLNFKKSASDLLEYEIKRNNLDTVLKVNVENFNQLADIPHFLDFASLLLEVPENIKKSYLHDDNRLIENDYLIEKIWLYHTSKIPGRRKIYLDQFITDEKLNKDIIFYTETFCIAKDIPAKYIEDIRNL